MAARGDFWCPSAGRFGGRPWGVSRVRRQGRRSELTTPFPQTPRRQGRSGHLSGGSRGSQPCVHEPALLGVRAHGKGEPREPNGVLLPVLRLLRQCRRERGYRHPRRRTCGHRTWRDTGSCRPGEASTTLPGGGVSRLTGPGSPVRKGAEGVTHRRWYVQIARPKMRADRGARQGLGSPLASAGARAQPIPVAAASVGL